MTTMISKKDLLQAIKEKDAMKLFKDLKKGMGVNEVIAMKMMV